MSTHRIAGVAVLGALLFSCAKGGAAQPDGGDPCAAASCDPCAGVTCTMPPADHCADAMHLTVSDGPGTCTSGACSYPTHDEVCTTGCANGACRCTVDAECAAAQWCNAGTCTSCDSDQHCGASCTDCSATSDHCSAGACVECITDNQCAAGDYCTGGTCAACNVAAHCGPSCIACSGTTPACSGTGCVCTATSCGSYHQCVGGACQQCTTAAACGATCSPCTGATPYCLVQGTTSACVECLSNADCSGTETCSAGTCVMTCAAPASACTASGDQDGSCAGAYTIPRAEAAAGFEIANTYGLCGRSDNFASVAGCESGGSSNGADAAYKLFMKTGESVHVVLTRGFSSCAMPWNANISLKIYGTPCSADCSSCPQTCTSQNYCLQSNAQATTYVAPVSGWYDIVVDSRGSATGDVGGVFDLQVTLTCAGGACTCP